MSRLTLEMRRVEFGDGRELDSLEVYTIYSGDTATCNVYDQ